MTVKARWFWITFVVGVLLDQATKIWVYTQLEYRVDEIQIIPGFLSIIHAQNPGAAFGMLTTFEYRHVVFLAFAAIAVWVVFGMYRQLPATDRLMATALGLIQSGAVGNAIDRVHKRTVTDFVRVYTDDPELRTTLIDWFGMAEWPAFNVADSALLIGVVLFFIHSMFENPDDAVAAQPGERGAASPPSEA